MQMLSTQDSSVQLEVVIAQRQDVESQEASRRINESEYEEKLQALITKKKREHKIILDEKSSLKFRISPAHKEWKLQVADFACNTRLTRDSNAFRQVSKRVTALYDNAYLFTLTEISSENFIKQRLSQGYLSDALLELYTTWDKISMEQMWGLIDGRLKKMEYRLIKSQLRQFAGEITAYAALQEDYEIGEALLERIAAELIGRLEAGNAPCRQLEFTVLLQLTDAYLREGDIVSARRLLQRCREAQRKQGDNLESVFSYYQVLEKETLLAIDEFDFSGAKIIMEKVCGSFRKLMQGLEMDINLTERFPQITSEYYGDALCMQIYAMLFLQREQPEIYGELCRLSDEALQQYPEYEGELERHRQYRSHVELEQGNYKEAVHWLFLAHCFHGEVTESNLKAFLEDVYTKEVPVSGQYYLMYYLLIMAKAVRMDGELAAQMYQALQEQRNLLERCGIRKPQENTEMRTVKTDPVREKSSGVDYHPQEIICWKYASYLNSIGKRQTALTYYKKAQEICFAFENYDTLQIIGIGITAEMIYCMEKNQDYKDAQKASEELLRKIRNLLQHSLAEKTKDFVESLQKMLEESQKKQGQEKLDTLWKISEKISY